LVLTAGLTVLLVALCAFVHYEVLRACNEALPRLRWIPGRAQVLIVTGTAFCSHLTQIALFAGAYWLLHDTSLGNLHGQFPNTATTFLYFSAETYTSLGFGDVYPVGAMRLIAGIEALTGLLMIGWTASFTYLEMCRHWIAQAR
jgi:hypothetical protein